MITIDTRITTRPVSYEVTILNIGGDIPEEEEKDFMKWFEELPDKYPWGFHLDYFVREDESKVKIEFYIRRL